MPPASTAPTLQSRMPYTRSPKYSGYPSLAFPTCLLSTDRGMSRGLRDVVESSLFSISIFEFSIRCLAIFITTLLWVRCYHRRLMVYMFEGAKVRVPMEHSRLVRGDCYFPRLLASGTVIGNIPDKAARNLQYTISEYPQVRFYRIRFLYRISHIFPS